MSDEKFLEESRRPRKGFVSELVGFMMSNKRYWLVPIVLVMLLFTVLMLTSTTGVAPFIYTLF
jgi:hypothetical protein